MGKIKQGILGGFSGTVATVVGATWKGIDYMRGLAKSHKNPKTPPQQAQRLRFGVCTKFTKLIKNDIIIPIWEKKAVKMSGSNLFVRTNHHCFDLEGNISDYQNMTLSLGDISLPGNITVANNLSGNGSVIISWNDNSGEQMAIPTDRFKLVTITGKNPLTFTNLSFIRSVESAVIQLPYVAGDVVNFYIFFSDPAGENFSPSFYAQLTISGTPTT